MIVSAVPRKIKAWKITCFYLKFFILLLGDEGPVFAMCMTGRGDEATLNHWIAGLQQKNAVLGQVPTLFLLKGGTKNLQSSSDRVSGAQDDQNQDTQSEDSRSKEEASG